MKQKQILFIYSYRQHYILFKINNTCLQCEGQNLISFTTHAPSPFPHKSQETLCLMMIFDIHQLHIAIWGAMVAIFSLSIFNCLFQMILHIQSSFPSPLIMDHSHLSCILNKGAELETGTQPHVSSLLLLIAVISLRAKG